MKRTCWLGIGLLIVTLTRLADAANTAPAIRERVSLNAGWRFTKGDPADAGGKLGYTNIKAWVNATGAAFTTNTPSARPEGNPGADVAYTQPGFNDAAWRTLNLPHDWGIEGPFDPALPGGTGSLPWSGVGWYRKHFTVPASDQGRRLFLDVDGAMSYANVWLNGQYVGGWPYGYASFQLDLTPYLKPGGDNVLAIRLDNPPASSRWYPGGGIYRNVWLVKTAPVHVGHWGTFVTTPEVAKDSATVAIEVTVDNQSSAEAAVKVKHEIYELDAKGNRSARAVAMITTDGLAVAPGKSQSSKARIAFKNPRLWTLQKPNLYVAVTSIGQDGKWVDSYETVFGVRTIKFDAEKGFFLNGEHVRLNGVNNHADLGALGTVVNVRGLERQIQLLQEMGCNAIRTSHNMPAPELLDLCDRMGILVMDESFDCWARRKTPNGYNLLWADWHEKDLRAEIRRDRNHPSVFMYSVGNEIGEQGSAVGNQILAELIKTVREEDTTRMTITANDGAGFSGFSPAEYVYAFNYEPQRRITYAGYHAQNPMVALLSSESASCISSRGIYVFPFTNDKAGGAMPDHQMSSYDLYAPYWANPPDLEFVQQDKYPYLAGEFVWTGFDYLGEPTNNGRRDTPDVSRSSYFGIIDLAGFPKDRFYIYQARWRPDFPMAHIIPHWNWPDRVGQITPVHVYTSGDEAELFLNGQSLGRRKKEQYQYRLRWDDVTYQPGELKIVAYRNGKKWATEVMKTTGPATKLTLSADRNQIRADGADLSFVTVTVADKDGLLVPRSNNQIKFSVEGPGEIVATDNGDATSFESFQAPERKAFNGLALVIIRAKAGQPGAITLKAQSEGLKASTVRIRSQRAN